MKPFALNELPHEQKIKRMGERATALLQLHLDNPKKWDVYHIVNELFTEFENMELEEDDDGDD